MKRFFIAITAILIYWFLLGTTYADGNNMSEFSKPEVFVSDLQINSISAALSKIANKSDAAQWVATVVAFLIGLAGIFSLPELIKKRFYEKPEIKVSIEMNNPDCLKIPLTNDLGQTVYETYYLRFKVENTGNYKLEDVELIALELYKKSANGRYSKVTQFLPMNLKWANFGELTMPKIPPLLYKHCDLGHVIENPCPDPQQNQLLQRFNVPNTTNAVLILDTQVTPNTGSNYLFPGDYKIKIVAAANNSDPKHHWFKIALTNAWTPNEQLMFQNNLKVERTMSI